MSRTQTSPNFYTHVNVLGGRVSRLERIAASVTLKDVDTTGLSSAQIDQAVFTSSTDAQPTDGLVITDATNHRLLVRQGGKWCYTTLTVIP